MTSAETQTDAIGHQLRGCRPPLGRTLGALSRSVDRALGEVGLSLGQYRALAFLADEKAASAASRLADKLAVSRPTITALVDGLVAKGWVERQVAEGDRRRVDHVVTKAGRKALHVADDAVTKRLADLAAHLDDDERAAALAGLEQWGVAIDRARRAKFEALTR